MFKLSETAKKREDGLSAVRISIMQGRYNSKKYVRGRPSKDIQKAPGDGQWSGGRILRVILKWAPERLQRARQ